MADDVIDGTAVEIVDAVPVAPAATSTAVARRERRSEVIRPLDAGQLVASFGEYQELLPRLLNDGDYQDAGRGKRFVKKSGWRKIATAFDLDVQLIRSTVERDEHGQPLRAEVWARAVAPSGRQMDGDGYCAVDEDRFSGPRGNRSKLENDLRATATTRAMNRAISGLVGMGEVSAEEIDTGVGQPVATGPPFGPAASGDLTSTWAPALTRLLDGDKEAARAAWSAMRATFGYMPEAVARALLFAADALPAPEMTEAELADHAAADQALAAEETTA